MKRVAVFLVLAFALMTTLSFAAEWSGTIVKSADNKVWFKTGDKTLGITNPEKATGFEGKKVKVAGTADDTAQTVTIETVTAEQM